MDMWTAESVDDIAGFPRGKWDIVQPEHDLETRVSALGNDGQVDLVIVPGLAFTEDGGRLGRGKGFYDRFLSTLRERASELDRPRPAAVGIAFGEQRFDEVPTDQYDVTLDAVVFGE
jgi:5-formyltetrahydrofolate cyclo-ligase